MEVLKPIFYNTRKPALESNSQSTSTVPKELSLMQNSFCEVYNDSAKSDVQSIDIQWQTQDEIDFRPKVVDTLSYINGNSYAVDKTFYFSWSIEEQQSTAWKQQWNMGKNFEFEVKLPDAACTLRIKYDHMHSTSTTSVLLSSEKSLQVTVAPRKTTIARLVLLVAENIELPFVATIKSVGVNDTCSGEHKIEGLWRGTLYKPSSSDIDVYETELGIM